MKKQPSSLLAPYYQDCSQVESVMVHPDYRDQFSEDSFAQEFAWFRQHAHSELQEATEIKLSVVPVQCGRARQVAIKLKDGSSHVTAKGGGTNPEFSHDKNLMRYQDSTFQSRPGFDGKFLYAEAIQDFFNSEVLRRIGVTVSRPVGIIDIGRDDSLFSFHADQGQKRACIYVRSFINQTRISDLSAMETQEVQGLLENLRHELFESKQTHKLFSLEELFYFIADRIAKSAAILQASGFKHGVLHAQQMTVAGELCDLGTGYWMGFPELFHWNQRDLCPYSKFSRQPITMQNLVVRTHVLSGEESALLADDSRTRLEQKFSLLGAFQRAFPILAQKIKNQNPAHFFWKSFEFHLRHIDLTNFNKNFDPRSILPNHEVSKFRIDRIDSLKSLEPKKFTWGLLPAKVLKEKNYETDSSIIQWINTPYSAPKECGVDQKIEAHLSGPGRVIEKKAWFGASFPEKSKGLDRALNSFTASARNTAGRADEYSDRINAVLDLFIYEVRGDHGKLKSSINPFFLYSHFKRYKLKRPVSAEYYLGATRQCHDQVQLSEVFLEGIQEIFPEAECMVLEALEGPGEMHWGVVVKIAEGDIRVVDSSFGLNFEIGLALSHPYLDRRFGRFWNFFGNARSINPQSLPMPTEERPNEAERIHA